MFMLKPQQELDFAKKIYEQELSILELKKKNLTLMGHRTKRIFVE